MEFLSQTALRGLYRDCRYSGYGTTASIAIKSLVPPSNFARRWPSKRRPLLWGFCGASRSFSVTTRCSPVTLGESRNLLCASGLDDVPCKRNIPAMSAFQRLRTTLRLYIVTMSSKRIAAGLYRFLPLAIALPNVAGILADRAGMSCQCLSNLQTRSSIDLPFTVLRDGTTERRRTVVSADCHC